MSRRTSDGARASALALVGLSLLLGCTETDVGRCCELIDPSLDTRIPTSTLAGGGDDRRFTSAIAQDPGFDCDSLTCVAYQGTRAFCTARCFGAEDCPEGFVCEPVLTSDPGPDAPIQPSDRFCVRSGHECSR